jgi:ADP-heptose:LPS heptosyltransferase
LEIFVGNPNLAPPGFENASNLEWVPFYKGSRLYNKHDRQHHCWIWNYDFRVTPGEVFFTTLERRTGERAGRGFVVVEPNVEARKVGPSNKHWGNRNWQIVAERLRSKGYDVIQFTHPGCGPIIPGTRRVRTRGFRDALSILANAALYLGPEGGLHHGAAALGVPAVVMFGAWIPPAVTGYSHHRNITRGNHYCGSLRPCMECQDALRNISVNEVYEVATEELRRGSR